MSPRRPRKTLWIVCLAAFVVAGSTCADVLHVDDDAPPGGDGMSWQTALNDLPEALRRAADVNGPITEIRIAQGVYRPTQRTDRKDPRSATFLMHSGLRLRGGYAGLGAPNPDARDINLYRTIFTGDLNGDDGPPGSWINSEDNAYHVVTASNSDDTAVLDGVTITAGSACCGFGQLDLRGWGGGLYSINASPTFVACTFTYNQGGRSGGAYVDTGSPTFIDCRFEKNRTVGVNQLGGGLCSVNANPTLQDCVFLQNQANRGGGMAHFDNGTATLTNCTFSQNQANGDHGGGIFVLGATIGLTNCTFQNNSAPMAGGAATFADGTDATVADSSFTDNIAGYSGGAFHAAFGTFNVSHCTFTNNMGGNVGDGGAVRIDGGHAAITNCLFTNNRIPLSGGAVYLSNLDHASIVADCVFQNNAAPTPVGTGGAMWLAGPGPTVIRCVFDGNSTSGDGGAIQVGSANLIINCLFRNNSAPWGDGGAVSCIGFSPTLINCTLVNNTASVGGAVHNLLPITLHNCVLWANTPNQIAGPGSKTLNFSNIQGGWSGPGIGNISDDPLFTNPAAGDFTLAPGSPCIDAADNAAASQGISIDLLGNPRFRDDPATSDTGLGTPPVVDMGCYEFQPGDSLCPWDCAHPPDGLVNEGDLIAVIGAWGIAGGPADFNNDGVVNVTDLLQLIQHWGPCP